MKSHQGAPELPPNWSGLLIKDGGDYWWAEKDWPSCAIGVVDHVTSEGNKVTESTWLAGIHQRIDEGGEVDGSGVDGLRKEFWEMRTEEDDDDELDSV